MNSNWIRWIHASIAVHFSNTLSPVPVFVIGDTPENNLPLERYELQIDGPDVVEHTTLEYTLRVYINLVTVTQPKPNIWYHSKQAGLGLSCFDRIIHVYKYGAETGDNPSEHIGCLDIVSDVHRVVFDGPKPQQFFASSYDAEYQIKLTGE